MSDHNRVVARARRDTLPFSRTLPVALLIEVLIALGAGSMLVHAASRPAAKSEPPIMVALEDVRPAPPKPRQEVRPTPKLHQNIPLPVPQPVAPPPPPVPQPVSTIADATPPPPPSTPAALTAAREAEFAARLKAAIQAAVIYPPAARQMGFQGKARIGFVYRDGATREVRIVQSSGNRMIDNAALAAVGNASYPPAPESLHGRDMAYQITVLFELNGTR